MKPTPEAPPFVLKTGSISALGDSLKVEGEIEDVVCQFIIDTGSNITIVRPNILKDVKFEQKIVPVETYLRTVTGETAPVSGRAKLKFRVGDFESVQEVWLAEFRTVILKFESAQTTFLLLLVEARHPSLRQ